ncbi:MAG: hypothetical protein Q7J12_05530, partial [Syntrophales bacterium]|nr:hypothetical protein [Syntrophales bacterium]
MKNHWARELFNSAKFKGIMCRIERVIHGWLETINVADKEYFTKSMTYDPLRRQYFQGVDPPKLIESGDYVLLCGGRRDILSDIFIIPWEIFFKTLEKGKPINTYKLPKEYFQYKFYLRDRDDRWLMSVQGGTRPVLDVTNW